jgi:DNA-binding XRE family transcriptional regulator
MKTIKVSKKTGVQAYTLDEVLTKANKSKKFQVEYNKELSRLNLAKQVRDARIERKLTQKAVADKIGIPQSVVARIESGTHGVSVDTLERIASVFGKRIQLI